MPLFRTLPVVIEAVQFTGYNMTEIAGLLGADVFLECADLFSDVLVIPTLEGNMTARIGDWIIRGVAGEAHPIKADIFAVTYERVDIDEGVH